MDVRVIAASNRDLEKEVREGVSERISTTALTFSPLRFLLSG